MKQKRVLWALFTGLLAAACLQQKEKVTSLAYEVLADSTDVGDNGLLEEADTLAFDEAMDEEPLPTNVDETFDEFLFLFDHSNRFQRMRVRFPITMMDAQGTPHELTKRQWEHHSMSLGQDFCTVLWNSQQQMDLSNEVLERASVEHIYLHSRLVETFDFERDNLSGQWMLAGSRNISFEDYVLAGFLDFYREFSSDSIYQRRHVRDPLNFSMASEDSEDGIIRGTIDVDQWFEFAPEIPSAVLVNINYGQRFENPQRIVMQMRGFSDSMQNLFTFQKDLNGRWKLTAFEN